TFDTTGHNAGDTYLLAVQADSAVSATDAYPWQMDLTATFSGGGTLTRTLSGHTAAVYNGGTPFGHGWSLEGVDSLVSVSGGVLLVHGGDSRFFEALGGGAFLRPAGDFRTLVPSQIDNTYTYTTPQQTAWHFDSGGLLTRVTDPHGLTRTFTYSGGLVATVSEPDGGLGTFSYSSGKLTTIQEPGGRTLTITYGLSNQVSGLQVPDGGLKTFTYDGSFRPTNFQWDLLNASFTYDATTGSA